MIAAIYKITSITRPPASKSSLYYYCPYLRQKTEFLLILRKTAYSLRTKLFRCSLARLQKHLGICEHRQRP